MRCFGGRVNVSFSFIYASHVLDYGQRKTFKPKTLLYQSRKRIRVPKVEQHIITCVSRYYESHSLIIICLCSLAKKLLEMNFSKLSGEFTINSLPAKRHTLSDKNLEEAPIKNINASASAESQTASSGEDTRLGTSRNGSKRALSSAPPAKAESRPTNFTKNDFSRLEIIGQFNRSFIVCRLEARLFVVDQHAADERNSLERLLKKPREKQILLEPICLSGDVSSVCLGLPNADISSLCSQGFVLTPDRLRLFCVPRELADRTAALIAKGTRVHFFRL